MEVEKDGDEKGTNDRSLQDPTTPRMHHLTPPQEYGRVQPQQPKDREPAPQV
jgi:hypothetical protein